MSGLDLRLQNAAPIPLDLALKVESGEVLAIVGASGAGKTSILRVIAGLMPVNAGHVRAAGECWFDAATGITLPPHRRRVGFLFQGYALFPHMSALENVLAAMGDQPGQDGRNKAVALLDAVQLDGLYDRRPAALSGGQQQRVALARALARSPLVLLLDEPFSAVDRPTRMALSETISALKGQLQMPTILVSHDIDDVVRLADRVAVIEAGRLLQQGTVAALRAAPATAQVGAMVGEVRPCL